MASRRCSCGAELAEVGPTVHCSCCGAAARRWLVAAEDGELLAAGSMTDIYVPRCAVIEALGVPAGLLST